jgi:hypothetical protein
MSKNSGQYLENIGFGGRIAVQGNIKQFYTGPNNTNSLTYQTIGGVQYQTLTDQNTTLYLSDVVISNLSSFSDRSLKDNIINLPEEKKQSLLDLNPTQFTFKSDAKKNIHYGFIAQDLEQIYPELVKDSEKGYRKVNYIEFIPLIISKMKDMQNEIDELKKQKLELKKDVKNNDV